MHGSPNGLGEGSDAPAALLPSAGSAQGFANASPELILGSTTDAPRP